MSYGLASQMPALLLLDVVADGGFLTSDFFTTGTARFEVSTTGFKTPRRWRRAGPPRPPRRRLARDKGSWRRGRVGLLADRTRRGADWVLRPQCIFVEIEIGTRRTLRINVADHPTAGGLCSTV
ncbi:MAG: hypothetical protein H6Q86_5606 [candidate division NC10 bacterium]|nr:hypothetical protein [candidate division NC10 bacterium]